jgi:UDP-N-acetylglucosamine 2-epimerase (non-hydrolysing)
VKKVLFIIGTRPEAIKLNPVIEKCEKLFDCKVCLTNQHQKLESFIAIKKSKIVLLNLKRKSSGLTELTAKILNLLNKNKVIKRWKPDLIVVHGDTTSSLCGAIYSFYEKIKLCHIESGLRTHDKNSPYPEEFNRRVIDYLSDINFCPTKVNKKNLINENVKKNNYVVGNTIIDVLKNNKDEHDENILNWIKKDDYILVTMHRRENWNNTIEKTLKILNKFSLKSKQKIIYVCNNNKQLVKIVKKCFKSNKNVLVLDPLSPSVFRWLIKSCVLVITDSGGIQEEACFYRKPLLVAREKTERVEAINNGCSKLINFDKLEEQLDNIKNLKFKSKKHLYGKGKTSDLIIKIIKKQ